MCKTVRHHIDEYYGYYTVSRRGSKLQLDYIQKSLILYILIDRYKRYTT